MPVLIDGYNLLHTMRDGSDRAAQIGRSILCRMLGDWFDACRVKVTVVFDGRRPDDGLARQIGDPRIDVQYSGARIADTMIDELAQRSTAGRRLLVVSTDREVQSAARRAGATPVTSDDFYLRLRRDLAASRAREREQPGPKQLGTPSAELDAWMKDFGFDAEGAIAFAEEMMNEIIREDGTPPVSTSEPAPPAKPGKRAPKRDGLTAEQRDKWLREFGYDE